MKRKNTGQYGAPLNPDEMDLLREWLIRVDDRRAVSVWTMRRLMATLDFLLYSLRSARRGA